MLIEKVLVVKRRENMKKLLLLMILAMSALQSANALAAKVKCEPAKFERIYQRDNMVYVQLQGLPWHVLGTEGDEDLNKKIDRLRKAERKGWYVQLVFPNGYDESCRVMDKTISVKKVKLKKSYNGDEVDAE